MTLVRPANRLVLASFVMLATVGIDRAAPLYPGPISETGGRGATDVALGDFNADGILDAAVTNQNSNDVSVMLGAGDGTFGPATRYPVGGPRRIVAGDFNLDGRPDLAVVNQSGVDPLSIMIGQGDGTFTQSTMSVPGGVNTMEAGDLNNDGKVDLVILYGQFNAGSYVKLISLGDGTFSVSAQIPTVSIPNGVTVADVDRDGLNDVVVGAYNTIAVHRGTGGGQFAAAVNYSTAFWNYSVQVADMNLDGRPDLLSVYTTEYPTPGAPDGFVQVMLALPGGGFAAGTAWPTGSYPGKALVADFDRDGRPDVAVAGQGGIDILRGQAGGSLATSKSYNAGSFANGIAAGDLDGDGVLDLAVASHSSAQAAAVDGLFAFHGAGDGTFGQPRIDSLAYAGSVVQGDFDEDGHEDFALMHSYLTPHVSIVHGNGNGTFGAVQSRDFTGSNPTGMVSADFNHDGHLDVAVSVDRAAVVFLGTGTGGLGAPVSYPAGDTHTTIAVGDLNEDGNPDLVLNNQFNDNVSVIWGFGDGTFSEHTRYTTGRNPEGISVADVDGDGHPDMVVGIRHTTLLNSGLAYVRNLGNYVFAPPVSVFWGGTTAPRTAVADLNADGRVDVVAWGDQSNDVSVFLGQGGGTFGPRVVFPSGDFPVTLKIADVTGDARLDLVVGDRSSTDIAVFEGNGGGGFAPRRRYGTFSPGEIDLGDFNEDGTLDVVVAAGSPTFLFHRPPAGSNPPVAAAGTDIVAECTSPAGTVVPLDGSGSTDPDSTPGTNDDIIAYEWFEDFGTPAQSLLGTGETFSPTLAFGTHLVTLRVRDGLGLVSTDDLLVIVRDTAPPVLSVAIVPSLWPPNHRLVPATALVSAIDACGSSTVTLVGVSSSEPDDAPGGNDGTTSDDIQGASPGTADFEFLLRAERSASGPGRTYSATYRAVDESGNVALVAGLAFVPHDQNGITDPVTIFLRETPAGTLVEWADVPAAESFEVAVGDLASLRAMNPAVGSFPPGCLASELHAIDTTGYEVAAVPAVGTAWFFLVSYMAPPSSGYGAESTPYDLEGVVPSDICP